MFPGFKDIGERLGQFDLTLGESIEPSSPPEVVRWRPDLPWERAEDAPAVSSGLAAVENNKRLTYIALERRR